jgi:iron complex transport system ATP-binding protein
MAVIQIKHLYFAYDNNDVLSEINMRVRSEEIVTLLGPNGSGKSTLLKCIYGILKPKEGSIQIDDRDLFNFSHSELARILGGIPQHHYPTFPFKVVDIVVMGRTPFLSMFSSPSDRDYEYAEDILQNLDILNLKEHRYTEISGGERQLALIARTLMQNPKVLLLDEPVTHLDLKNKAKVLGTIKRIAKEKHLTIVATLHDPNDAIMFSDRIALIKKGQILEYGKPQEIVNEANLQHLYDMTLKVVKQDDINLVTYKA